jgi:GNAT superfamily N-acetyltransferase
MIKISHYSNTPPEHIWMQIVSLAAENFTDISMYGTPPSNPLFPIHQAALALEISMYIRAMGSSPERPVGLFVATAQDDPNLVIGFLKYLPLKDMPEACGITYMAVRQEKRRRGVARALMGELLALHPHTELTCFVEKVPLYEKLGFRVIGHRDTQVRMCTREKSAEGVMAVLDTSQIYSTPPIQMTMHMQVQKVGEKAMSDGARQFSRYVDQQTRKAKAFAEAKHFVSQGTHREKR